MPCFDDIDSAPRPLRSPATAARVLRRGVAAVGAQLPAALRAGDSFGSPLLRVPRIRRTEAHRALLAAPAAVGLCRRRGLHARSSRRVRACHARSSQAAPRPTAHDAFFELRRHGERGVGAHQRRTRGTVRPPPLSAQQNCRSTAEASAAVRDEVTGRGFRGHACCLGFPDTNMAKAQRTYPRSMAGTGLAWLFRPKSSLLVPTCMTPPGLFSIPYHICGGIKHL